MYSTKKGSLIEILHTSNEMVSYILKNTNYYPNKTQVGSKWYIGYQHLVSRLENTPEVLSKSEAKEIFIEDIQKIENYHLLKNIKTKLNPLIYDVSVHFIFDYGFKSFKNSQFLLYVTTNNTEKCIEELNRYIKHHTILQTNLTDNRKFDIQILRNSAYNKTEVKNVTKQRIKRNVGFRY